MALTMEQKDAFWRDGFLPVQNLLAGDEVEALRRRTDQISLGEVEFLRQYIQNEPDLEGAAHAETLDPLHRVRKIWRLTDYDPVFQLYARHPAIVAVVVDLLGPDVKLYADQMLLKPPFHGSAKPYQQDSAYWPIEPRELVTCWLAMDDATRENGCMRFLPGTHRLGLV